MLLSSQLWKPLHQLTLTILNCVKEKWQPEVTKGNASKIQPIIAMSRVWLEHMLTFPQLSHGDAYLASPN